jgi:MHS family proline/betaine transporter-like MFS transporter
METDEERRALIAMRRILIAGMVGNVLEWYDFALFGFFAPVLARLFFPSDNQLASLIDTFGVFAAGFLMRPLGAALIGGIGDRLGRRKALIISVMLMAIPTFLIGFLPTYDHVGVVAPMLLTLLRLLQGLSMGGEYTGSFTYLVESAPSSQRGYIGSWMAFSATIGTIVGSTVGALITSNLSDDALYSWGLRLPFLCGITIGGVGLYLRRGIAESPDFEAVQVSGAIATNPVRDVLTKRWPEILTAVGLNGLATAAFYIVFVYLTTYLASLFKFPLGAGLTINTVSLVILMLLLPLMGALSDRIGRKPLLLLSSMGLALLSYPLFRLIGHDAVLFVFGAQFLFTMLLALYFGPMPAVMVELFPARERCSGIAIGYNLAGALFGGTAPLIATYLVEKTGDLFAPSYYLMVCAIVSVIVVLRIPETAFVPLK